MRKLLRILLSLCLALSLSAGTTFINGPAVHVAAGGPSYLLSEGFEGTGYENSWTEGGTGTIDEDYATSPAPLSGSQSLRLAMSSQNGNTFATFTGTSEVWAYFQINWATLSPSGKVFFQLANSSGTAVLSLELNATQKILIRVGSANTATTDSVSSATTYNFWVHYKKGTGSDAVGEVGFSTDGTKPTSGNKYANRTTGTATTDAARFYCGTGGNATWEAIFDNVRVDDVNIGDNPT